jgi:tryptophanyl-tRNA synthetase
MKQIATGIQTTGSPHLGNIVGAIQPAIAASRGGDNPAVFIIADMHSMLTVRSREARLVNTRRVAAAWIAFGASENGIMYRQSRIPELSEIAMLLSGTASMTKVMEGGLKPEVFTNIHPVLMTADLLMVGTTHVPVGIDSHEHIEIVRDTAARFNDVYGPLFAIPEGVFGEGRPTVPGTDGRKMSKAFDNCIDVLDEPKAIAAAIARIEDQVTAGAAGETAPPSSIIMDIASAIGRADHFASASLTDTSAKARLGEILVEDFRLERARFCELMAAPDYLGEILAAGEEKISVMAGQTLHKMRNAMGMA